MKKILSLSAVLLFLSACQTHIVKLGDPHEHYTPTPARDVAVYYKQFPDCKYREIALLDNPVGDSEVYGNLQKAIDVIKEKAAKQGADFIRIGDWSRWSFNDKKVSYVIAYKCIK